MKIKSKLVELYHNFLSHPHPELGTYILGIKVLYDVQSTFFMSPIQLIYDQNLNEYVLRPCRKIQRIFCLLILCLSSISIYNNVRQAGKALLSDTGYIVAYFDYLNVFTLNCAIYPHAYIQWYQTKKLNAWIHNLQKSCLVQFCTLPVWKIRIFAWTMCLLTFYLFTVWALAMFGHEFKSAHLIYDASEGIARQLFWLDENREVGPFLRVLTIICRFYDAYCLQVTLGGFFSIFAFISLQFSTNVFNAILTQDMESMRGLKYFKEYQRVLESLNNFFGFHCFHVLGTTMTWWSIHLFDALNVTSFTWKINMFFYICYLISFFNLPMHTFMQGKRIKKWLWLNKNYMNIPPHQLKNILFDLTNDRKLGHGGTGQMYVVTPGFSGTMYELMCTFSLMNLQSFK